MINWIKRIAFGALFVTLAYFCVLFMLPYFAPQNEIREAVIRSLAATTGMTPRLDGPASFTILPRPTVRFDGVRFGDGGRGDSSAGFLQASVRLMPLLFGDVEIASLTFGQPHLDVEITPDGVKIMGLPLRAPAAAGEIPDFPEIKIVDGLVDLHGEGAGRIEQLSAVNASFAWSGASLATVGSFRWRETPGTASLFIADVRAVSQGARSGFRMRLDSDPLRLGFEGGLVFRKGIQAEGALSMESGSLRTALSSFGIEPPIRDGFGPFSLKTRALITPAALTASGLAIELDGNRAEGTLTLTFDAGRPSLQGTLASETADFSRYGSGFSMTSADGQDWSREPLDIKSLGNFDLDLRLSAGKIIFSKTEIEKAALAASVRNGRFTLSAGEGQMFGGVLRGAASIGPSGNGADIKIDADIKNFDSASGLAVLAGIRQMEGTGSLAFTLSGSGASVNAITHNLQGSADLNVQDGALKGINIEQALRSIERKPLAALAEIRGGRTPFSRFSAKLAISNGTASIDQAEIESDTMRVTFGGLASIPQRDLDLRGTASLISANTASVNSPFALPFFVRGSWDDPHLLPDPAALLKRSDLDGLLPRVAAAESDETRSQRPGIGSLLSRAYSR